MEVGRSNLTTDFADGRGWGTESKVGRGKLEAISTKTKNPQPEEPRALTRAHTAMETMRDHFKENIKTDMSLIESRVSSRQDNFNHGFHGCCG